jgi:hypothetical protein
MSWILEHLQIVFIVIIGLVSIVKSTLEAKEKARREQSGEDDFFPDEDFQSASPSIPPPLPDAGYERAVAYEEAKALKHQQDLADRLRQIRETKATTVGGAAATRLRLSQKGQAKKKVSVSLPIRQRLRNPVELRQAFVMREILDTPVGLR